MVHEIDVPPNSEMILPVRPRQPMERDEQGTYCEPASTAQVMVEACANLPGPTWWLKVMNLQEQSIRISQEDVLAYTWPQGRVKGQGHRNGHRSWPQSRVTGPQGRASGPGLRAGPQDRA